MKNKILSFEQFINESKINESFDIALFNSAGESLTLNDVIKGAEGEKEQIKLFKKYLKGNIRFYTSEDLDGDILDILNDYIRNTKEFKFLGQGDISTNDGDYIGTWQALQSKLIDVTILIIDDGYDASIFISGLDINESKLVDMTDVDVYSKEYETWAKKLKVGDQFLYSLNGVEVDVLPNLGDDETEIVWYGHGNDTPLKFKVVAVHQNIALKSYDNEEYECFVAKCLSDDHLVTFFYEI